MSPIPIAAPPKPASAASKPTKGAFSTSANSVLLHLNIRGQSCQKQSRISGLALQQPTRQQNVRHKGGSTHLLERKERERKGEPYFRGEEDQYERKKSIKEEEFGVGENSDKAGESVKLEKKRGLAGQGGAAGENDEC